MDRWRIKEKKECVLPPKCFLCASRPHVAAYSRALKYSRHLTDAEDSVFLTTDDLKREQPGKGLNFPIR